MFKKILILLLLSAITSFGQSVKNNNTPSKLPFQKGESLKFRISYSNFFGAGYASIEVKESKKNGVEAYHIKGVGKTTGVISWFFKVEDDYQTYINKETLQPYRFIRKINEGGYTKDKEILFDHDKNEAVVKNHKHNTEKMYPITNNVQDMLSALYYLRNQEISSLEIGEEIELNMFFDQEINNFKLHW